MTAALCQWPRGCLPRRPHSLANDCAKLEHVERRSPKTRLHSTYKRLEPPVHLMARKPSKGTYLNTVMMSWKPALSFYQITFKRTKSRTFHCHDGDVSRCPLLAQSGDTNRSHISESSDPCPLLGVKRTSRFDRRMSANDPKRTFGLSVV